VARVAEVLGSLDLLPFANRPITSLSGGERQRAVLGRALSQDASVLLLDEPTTALDLGHQQQVLELVHQLRERHRLAVISTLHDLTFAAAYGDRLIVLVEGRVVASGKPAEVLEPKLIEEYFGATVEVLQGPDGPVVLPVRRRPLRPV
jgi:iron complex transport system ATP-binding protein